MINILKFLPPGFIRNLLYEIHDNIENLDKALSRLNITLKLKNFNLTILTAIRNQKSDKKRLHLCFGQRKN